MSRSSRIDAASRAFMRPPENGSRPVGRAAFTLELTEQCRPVSVTHLGGSYAAGHALHAHLHRLADEVFAQRNQVSSARQPFHLLTAGLFKAEHPRKRLRNRSAGRKRAMVAQDHDPAVRTEITHQALTLAEVDSRSFVVVISKEMPDRHRFLRQRHQ